MKIKMVMRYDRLAKRFRLFRVIYANNRKMISFALCKKLYLKENDWNIKSITVLGIRVSYHKPNGGFKC